VFAIGDAHRSNHQIQIPRTSRKIKGCAGATRILEASSSELTRSLRRVIWSEDLARQFLRAFLIATQGFWAPLILRWGRLDPVVNDPEADIGQCVRVD
jgi:hypothetical protein